MPILSSRKSFAWIYYNVRIDKCKGNCSCSYLLVQLERSLPKAKPEGQFAPFNSVDVSTSGGPWTDE
jgi:hypothetical protein